VIGQADKLLVVVLYHRSILSSHKELTFSNALPVEVEIKH
jgi:hypothetical protein